MKLKFYTFAFFAFILFASSGNSFAQVKTWGYNAYGQIGDGGQTNQPTPVNAGQNQTTGFGGGYIHSLFLQANGTVLAVGENYYGSLGDGTTTTTGCYCKLTPVTVSGISTAVQVAGGYEQSLALLADGTVTAWGRNDYGQLGDGTKTDRATPVFVSGLTNVTAIQAGALHSIALKSDGTVWTWGSNSYGQLGDNTTVDKLTPVQVSGLTNVVAVSSGDYHSTALKADGTVWVWGNNLYGQVGNNTSGTNTLVPTQATIAGVSQISVGAYHNLALKPDGSVWIWGNNSYGQVGNGSALGNQLTPVQNTILTNVIDVNSDGYTNYIRRRDGSIQAWGYNNVGEVGDGTSSTVAPNAVSTPVQSAVGTGNPILGAGYYHAFVSKPQITTSVGTNQTLQGDSVKLTFANVTAAGTTTYTAFDPTIYTTLPTGYTVSANEPAYNISTTAVFNNVDVCLQLNADYDPAILSHLRILHYENGQFTDRTTTVNLRTRQLCTSTAALTPFSPFLVAQSLSPTAADVSISGRVMTGGRGLANARVNLTGTGGTTRTVTTNSFGNFTINKVEAGATYVVNVSAKRYTFAPQVVSVTDSVSGLTFSAQ